MHFVASAGEASRQLGQEGLRATSLRLSDRADQRGDDRYLHAAITLKAMSRGGLTPTVPKDTRHQPPRRTCAAARG